MKGFFISICLFMPATFVFGVEYSFGDSFDTVKNKNPGLTFNGGISHHKYKFYTVEGYCVTTTETILFFDMEMRLFQIVTKCNGATFDTYETIVEKCTKIYGTPKEVYPVTTNFDRGFSSANCSFEDDNGYALLFLILPLDEHDVPYVMLVEDWKCNELKFE